MVTAQAVILPVAPRISTWIPYQMLYQAIGLFLLLAVPFKECKKVHELMTDHELMHSFKTTRDKVPDYDVVKINHSLHKRSVSQDFIIKFKAFGSNVLSYLNPIDGHLFGEDTPVWIAEKIGRRVRYRQLKQGIMKDVLGFYQNVTDRAALMAQSCQGGELQFHGTIRNLSVIPLPDRVQQEFEKTEKTKRNLAETEREKTTTKFHIVFRSNRSVQNRAAAQQHNDISSFERSSGYTVYPTILVTTDFNLDVESENDSAYYDQILYQMAFWNGVDLRFRQMKNPQVRLRIAGLVIGSDRRATPYIHRSMRDNEINLEAAVDKMEIYWNDIIRNRIFSRQGFHIVATLSNLKMVREEEGRKTILLGRARSSSICMTNRNKFLASTILSDNLSFDGIVNAVHEFGHIFGAAHDSQDRCPSSDGFLMSAIYSMTVNSIKWSNCSLEKMQKTLRDRHCTDKPREYYSFGKPLERVLPGALRTLDEQCQASGYAGSCMTKGRMCKVLQCFSKEVARGTFKCYDTGDVAEGTRCGPNSYCIDGECLHP